MANTPIVVKTYLGKENHALGDKDIYYTTAYDVAGNPILSIPMIDNYKPAKRINTFEDAVHKSWPAFDKENQVKLDKFLKVIEKPKVNIQINNIDQLDFAQLYFLTQYAYRVGLPEFNKNDINIELQLM